MTTANITIALTSCGRFELLKKTILSLEETIDLSLYPKILTEDSKDEAHIQKMYEAQKNWFLKWWEILFTGWSGQTDLYKCHYYALKTLYSKITTKYVFHGEDDQIFKKVDFNYFTLSEDILEMYPHIGLVLLRDIMWDFWLKKTWIMKSRYYELLTDEDFVFEGHHFLKLAEKNSFTLQPWLRRTWEMKEIMFWYEDFVDEGKIGERYNKKWLCSMVIIPGIFHHINPRLHSTKNIKNMWFFWYFWEILKGTFRYRTGLLIKYLADIWKK